MSDLRAIGSIEVDAPASTIFDILADPRQHAVIDGSGTVRDSVSGPERLSLGAKFGMDMKLGAPYKIGNTVVEFEPDRLIAWRHKGLHRWRYELEPLDGGARTKVTETWDASYYPRLLQLGLKAAGFPARNQAGIDGTLPKLKAEAERRA